MTDWAGHLGRTRRWMEQLAWAGAAMLVMLIAATGAALAMWLDRSAGDGNTQQAILLDLPPMPAAEAVSEDPGPQPETAPELAASLDNPDGAESPPEPELAEDLQPELDSPDQPDLPEQLAEQLPETDLPPPPPETPKVEKAEVPLPAAKEKPKAAPKKKAQPKSTAQAASKAANAGAATAKGGATADDAARWEASIVKSINRHMGKKNYPGKGKTVQIRFGFSPSGQVTSVAIVKSSGDPETDAALLAQARRMPAVKPTYDGKTQTRTQPIGLR